MHWHEGERFDVAIGDSRAKDAGHTRYHVEVHIKDKDKNEQFNRVGDGEQIGNFCPIWVVIDNQRVTVEELLQVPKGGDLIHYGETLDHVPKGAKFVRRFRYRAPNASTPVGTPATMYVSPGALIQYVEHYEGGGEGRRWARVLDRPIYDGCGEPLGGIYLRVIALSDDMHSAYQRYVPIEGVRLAMPTPHRFAKFFFAEELPDPETVIAMQEYGSLNERYIEKAATSTVVVEIGEELVAVCSDAPGIRAIVLDWVSIHEGHGAPMEVKVYPMSELSEEAQDEVRRLKEGT